MLGVVVLVLILLFAWRFGMHASELACLSSRGGRTILVRGALPPGVERELSDVLERARPARATVRIVRGPGHARVEARGVDEAVQQRLRNALGLHPIRTGSSLRPPASRNLGQLLGIEWLAWLLLRGR